MCLEVFYPGEDVAHGAGVLVAGSSMPNGISIDHVLMIFECESHEVGFVERRKGCVGGAKDDGF